MTIEEYTYFIKKLKIIGYSKLETKITDNIGKRPEIDIKDIYYRDNGLIAFINHGKSIKSMEFCGETIRHNIEQTKLVTILRSYERLELSFFKSETVALGSILFTLIIYTNSGVWAFNPMYSCFDSNNKKYLYSTSKNTMYVMHNGGVPCVMCKENNWSKAQSRRFYFVPEYNTDRVVYYFEFEHDLKEITHTCDRNYKGVSLNIEKGEIIFRLNPLDYFSYYLCSFRLHVCKLDDHEDWLKDSNVYLEKMRQ